MEKEARPLARLAGRAMEGVGGAARGIGRYFTQEGPLIPGAPGRYLGGLGEEFNLGRQGIARGSNAHLEQMGLGGTGWKGPGPSMSNEQLFSQGLHAPGYTPPTAGGGAGMGGGGAGTATGTAGAAGAGAGGAGGGAAGAAGAAAAGAAGRGLRAPTGFQRTMSKMLGPNLAHYPMKAMQLAGQHPGAVGAGAGILGMHELHNYEDAKKRDAIANMGAMDRLQAALGLVFNPQATANRLY